MRNKESILRQLKEIKQEQDTKKALNKHADKSYEIGQSLCEDIKSVDERVNKLSIIIIGNGSPSEGLVRRIEAVEENMPNCITRMSNMDSEIKDIKSKLFGGIGEKKPSMLHRISKIEEYTKNKKTIDWYVFFAIIGFIITQILTSIF